MAISSRDWNTARVQASFRASEGRVTSDLENKGLLVKTRNISARRLNLSGPPHRKTERGVSSGELVILFMVELRQWG